MEQQPVLFIIDLLVQPWRNLYVGKSKPGQMVPVPARPVNVIKKQSLLKRLIGKIITTIRIDRHAI